MKVQNNYRVLLLNKLLPNRIFAFSLVEMLMALLVASLLLAALAPVMTRKITENVNFGGGSSKTLASYECFPYSDSLGDVTYNLDEAYYANFVIASGGGGGAGATKEKVITKNETYKVTGTTSNVQKDIPITNTMTKVVVTQLIGGGGGGGRGATYKNTEEVAGQQIKPSAENCTNYGEKYAAGKTDTVGNQGTAFATYDNTKLCVTKFNQKTSTGCYTGSASAASGTMYKYTATYCTKTDGTSEGYSAYPYIACGRVVCSNTSAFAACNNLAATTGHKWRLPTNTELETWSGQENAQALSLCDQCPLFGSTRKKVLRCENGKNVAGKEFANPYEVWGYNSGTYYTGNLDFRTFKSDSKRTKWWKVASADSTKLTKVLAVRCVLDSWNDEGYTTYEYGAYGGGGGGSAGYLANIDITNYVKQAQNTGGGTIRIIAGGGGAGAPVNGNAANGGNSNIFVYNKSGTVIYAWASDGGRAGGNATSSAAGAGGTSPGCLAYNGSAWTSTNCSTNGIKGANGAAPARHKDKTPVGYLVAAGGSGANSSYSNGATGGGTGGNAAAGGAAGSYGGGGGGGARSDGSAVVHYAGGNGAGGIAEVNVTYEERYAGSGGGGGAGGNVAKISNVDVGKNSTCTIHVGAGGYGGSFDTGGSDGVWSWVKCVGDHPTAEFYVYGGLGGKKGTTATVAGGKATGGLGGGIYNNGFSDSINKPVKGLTVNRYLGKAGTNGVEGKAGIGGDSGAASKGGCGGLNKLNTCIYNVSSSVFGSGFTYQNILVPEFKDIQNKVFGTFGSGGGGGAYDKSIGAGTGGRGMGGYVCIYYYSTNEKDKLRE